IIIPKEEATFWLDNQRKLHNERGEFQHKEIIDFFHSNIKKDKTGYYISQTYKGVREKVYFRYEDTALFVFDVVKEEGITLELNTKKTLKLNPKRFFLQNEDIYIKVGKEKAKFVGRGMERLADLLEYDGCFWITLDEREYRIPEL
ncbi:MAG: MFS transporter permease, partial [Nanoarchaeota archaeon]|nr:MFS transporter permease [Nanoarchaeota archaeon]